MKNTGFNLPGASQTLAALIGTLIPGKGLVLADIQQQRLPYIAYNCNDQTVKIYFNNSEYAQALC